MPRRRRAQVGEVAIIRTEGEERVGLIVEEENERDYRYLWNSPKRGMIPGIIEKSKCRVAYADDVTTGCTPLGSWSLAHIQREKN